MIPLVLSARIFALAIREVAVAGKPGTWIHIAAQTPHSIKATTPVVMLLTLLKASGE
tara:strand:- start:35220 stop:35390 length:171 start_codon:yes stop_codon:yes gene_type:complete